MKKTARSVAFATILIPLILSANSTTIKFDTALTNGTEWSFNDKVGNNNNGYYLLQDAEVATPQFGFNITSVEIRVTTTSSCNRNLIIRPGGNASSDSDCAFNTIPAGTTTNLFATWNTASPVRSFIIKSTVGSKGNLYIKSAVISGAPIIDAPTNLQADDIKGTRCGLSWTNPANAVSNRVDVLEVTRIAGSSSVERKYDFNEFSNDGNTSQQTDRIVSTYPDLSGFMLCLPTNTAGQIQLSNRDDKGVLTIREFESYEGLRLELIARHYDHPDEVKTMSIGYVLDGATNDFASVELASGLSPSSIPLSEVPAGARLILNNSGNKRYHRVIIDEISFVRNFTVSTNLVTTAFVTDSTTYSVRGLCPRTEYVARITAFDAYGNESKLSEPLAVTTNDEAIPFSIRIQ